MAHSLRRSRVVNKVDLVAVLADVARALVRLHSAGHIHRDVKARNVLVSADFRTAKLADFGLARPLAREPSEAEKENGGMTPRIGPRKYRAPEVEAGLRYGAPCDMYSFGVMIRELLDTLRSRNARRYGDTMEVLRLLGSCCRRVQPEERPSAMEALTLLQQHAGKPLVLREGGSARHASIAPRGALASRLRGGLGTAEAVGVGSKRRRSRSGSGRSESSGTSARLVRCAQRPGDWGQASPAESESEPPTRRANGGAGNGGEDRGDDWRDGE